MGKQSVFDFFEGIKQKNWKDSLRVKGLMKQFDIKIDTRTRREEDSENLKIICSKVNKITLGNDFCLRNLQDFQCENMEELVI